MSGVAQKWAWNQELPRLDKLVLVVLAWHADERGFAWANLATMMQEVGLSKRGIQNQFKKLEKRGLIKVNPRFTTAGRQTSNEYILNLGGCTIGAPPRVHELVHGEGALQYAPHDIHIEIQERNTNPGEPGKENFEMKIQEVITSLSPLEEEEILFNARKKNGKITPSGCGFIWTQFRRLKKAKGFQGELLKKELRLLSDSRDRIGQDNFNKAIQAVMENWIGFTKFAKTKGGAYQLPQQPNISFFRKFCSEAVDFASGNQHSPPDFLQLSANTRKDLTKTINIIDTPDSEAALKALLALDEDE